MFKIISFIKSFFLHLFRGMPKSKQDEINRRFEICNQCAYYNKHQEMCLECGCKVNKSKDFMNKLSWGDQKCPLAKW